MEAAVEKFRDSAKMECDRSIEQMILFGSFAKGKQTKDSDIDMLVVWKGDRRKGWERLERIAFRLLLETEQYISLKVITPQEFKRMRTRGDPFIKNIMKEGIIIA